MGFTPGPYRLCLGYPRCTSLTFNPYVRRESYIYVLSVCLFITTLNANLAVRDDSSTDYCHDLIAYNRYDVRFIVLDCISTCLKI